MKKKIWFKILSSIFAFVFLASSVGTTVSLVTSTTSQQQSTDSDASNGSSGNTNTSTSGTTGGSSSSGETSSSNQAKATSTSSFFTVLEDSDGYYVEMGYYPTTYAGLVSDCSFTSTGETFTLGDGTEYDIYTDGTDEYIQYTTVACDSDSHYTDGTFTEDDVDCYFKIEPIKWDVLGVYTAGATTQQMSVPSLTAYTGQELGDDEQLVVQSRLALESMAWYAASYTDSSINYVDSDIYSWLGSFYTNVLSDYSSYIVARTIDYNTTASHTSISDYYDNYTTEYVWLMSYTEASTWYSSSSDRIAYLSDFAVGSGAMCPSSSSLAAYWWLRSSYLDSSSYVYAGLVNYGGRVSDDTVDVDYYCVRPAMLITIPDTSVDLGVYSELEDEDGNQVQYWISDLTYFSTDWLTANAGTESDPYIIDSAEDLAGLSYLVFTGDYTFLDCYFTQTCDIDLSGTTHNSTGLYWFPIGYIIMGNMDAMNFFMGDYDGRGHTISNLTTYFDENYEDLNIFNYAGLFGVVGAIDINTMESLGTASVHDIGIVDSVFEGYWFVGAVAGGTIYAEISNCYNSSSVTSGASAAGIVGYAQESVITDCYNQGIVASTGLTSTKENSTVTDTGASGIVGVSYGSTISNCYNLAKISGVFQVAGILSKCYVYDTYTEVRNCWNGGEITGTSYGIGGIAGCVEELNIYNCYNVGEICGERNVGGIVGSLYGSIYNCYNTGDVTSTSTKSNYYYYLYVGGVVGWKNSSTTISNCYYGDCTITGKDTDGNDVTYQKGVGYDSSTSAEGVDSEGVTEYLSGISSLAKTKSWYTNSDNWDATYPWDMTSTWVLNANYNSSYPILRSLLTSYAEYDSTGDFWYILDGYMPQSYCDSTPTDVDASAVSEAYTIRLSTSSWAQVEIFSGTDDDYAYVTIYSGSNVEVASAWFVVEPIVWIVAYGSETPTSVTSAVTAQIVTAGYVYSNAGTSFSWAMSSVLGMSVETLESYMGLTFASVGDFAYDSFSGSLSQLAVNDDATTLSSKIAVSSVDEIDALGGTYASTCTDFVAFLLSNGSSTDGDSYSANNLTGYWTRDLAATLDDESTYGEYTSIVQLNNGVYVTKDGTLNNAKLSTLMGARLTMNV